MKKKKKKDGIKRDKRAIVGAGWRSFMEEEEVSHITRSKRPGRDEFNVVRVVGYIAVTLSLV